MKKKSKIIGRNTSNAEVKRKSNRYFSKTFFLRESNNWRVKVKGNNKNKPTAKGHGVWHENNESVTRS